MDKGAHFYHCDFQVHSPRDRNWNGFGAISEPERTQYAKEFIAATRAKGLDAVAITDHHDMAFVSYIRRAAIEEVDASGNLIPAERRIIVFPGMELTLAIPCQALLIFDADFPEDLFPLALTALAIVPSASNTERTAETRRLDEITTFDILHEHLDRHSFLRDRYIVIPNVSEGGSSTLLRSGHASHYKNMPCLAGYLDGAIEQLGAGNRQILDGRNSDYGQKALGIFQTSDNRRRDFQDLGIHTSWVKWAQPTAEALRQACLARVSRISQAKPLLPAVTIASINISNSAFLGPLFLEFNQQYNAIIGGRGTGKSTILEYLRWALCDEPIQDDADLPAYQKKRDALVRQTLMELKANIQVDFIVNGVPHSVRRNSSNNELLLKIGAGNFEACKPTDIHNLLPVQAYSQKQLSNVGVRVDELARFINSPVRREIDGFDSELRELTSDLRKTYLTLQQLRQLRCDVENDDRLILSLTEQITSARRELTGIGDADQAILTSKTGYDRESETMSVWAAHSASIRIALEALSSKLQPETDDTNQSSFTGLPNEALLTQVNEERRKLFASMLASVDEVDEQLRQSQDPSHSLAVAETALTKKHQEFEVAYEAAKAKSTAHESKLQAFNALEQQLKSVRARLVAKKAELGGLGSPDIKFRELRAKWQEVQHCRSSLLEQQCEHLTQQSENQIRATLKRGHSADDFLGKLKAVLAGTNIRGTKLDSIIQSITSSADPIAQLETVLGELEALSLVAAKTQSSLTLPPTPLLILTGFSFPDLEKLARKLTPELWVDLALTVLKDAPIFEYRVRESEYIAFADASAGQQATALLWVLLNQDGPPLIIDQPEDDLDNKVMAQTVEKLWKAKRNRQVIFSSHNANLVVNGDADLLLCCDYRVTGEQSGGTVKLQGAIDVADIRNEIASVMEGGREAFKLRKDKYGF